MALEGKREYFNDLATRWDALPGPPDAAERVALFCRRACPREARRILDVGCGTGILVPHVRETAPGARLVELDFAIEMLRESARKRPGLDVLRICADALRLPFPDACFDVVLCFGILPHLGAPDPAVRELWRVLQPCGVLAVGHLMGSEQLNLRHQEIGGAVGHDELASTEELSSLLRGLDAKTVTAEDLPERYFVRAEKGGA